MVNAPGEGLVSIVRGAGIAGETVQDGQGEQSGAGKGNADQGEGEDAGVLPDEADQQTLGERGKGERQGKGGEGLHG
jgi:hypothetical protein